MKTLERDLNKLPKELRQAVEINVKLLEQADFSSKDIDVYLDYMTKKILFVEFSSSEEGVKMCLAFAYDEESMRFFEDNLSGIFRTVMDLFHENNWHLSYKIQFAPDNVRDHVQTIRNILYRYSDYLRSEYVAAKAQKQIEERKSVGLDSILKKSHYAQNNLLTKSGFSDNLTVVQKKVLNYFIYKYQNQKEEDLFGNAYFNVTTQELVNCGCGSNTNAIMKSLKDLMENTTMYIQFGENWTMYNIFSSFQGAVNKNNITVRFTPEMTALINKVGVSRNYTMLSIKAINTIKRYASMRMYEFCCQYKNMDADHVTITDDQLRMMLNCKDKYPNPREFKRAVLQTAEKELRELAQEGKIDLYFSFSETKKEKANWAYDTKRVLEWSFVIHKAYSYAAGFIPHEKKEDQVTNALKTIADILFRYDDVSQEEKMRYSRFCQSLSADILVSLVQELQFMIMFSPDKSKEAINTILQKYGFKEGEK